MSRNISIWYSQNGNNTSIDTGYNDLFGTQQVSLKFWSQPILKEIGLKRLIVLGYADPIGFIGWDDLKELENEILLLEKNRKRIDFNEELLNRWISNLKFCLNILIEKSPQNAEPNFVIG